jgi:hypothetical protein
MKLPNGTKGWIGAILVSIVLWTIAVYAACQLINLIIKLL